MIVFKKHPFVKTIVIMVLFAVPFINPVVAETLIVGNDGTETSIDSTIISSTNNYDVLKLNSGGSASNTTINDGGKAEINGGEATDTTVNQGGQIQIISGTLTRLTINEDGDLEADEGGSINDLNVKQGGTYLISTDVNVSNALISSATTSDKSGSISDKTASDMLVNENSVLIVTASGEAKNTVVEGGFLHVESGGTVSTATISNGGSISATSGNSSLSGVSLSEDSSFNLSTLATVSDFINLSDNTSLGTIENGTADSFVINKDSSLTVEKNETLGIAGVANNTTVSGGELFVVGTGAIANSTNISDGGSLIIKDSSSADVVTITNSGQINVSGKNESETSKISNVTLTGENPNNASLTIEEYGIAEAVILNNNSQLAINTNGSASNVDVNNGAIVKVNGTLTDSSVNVGGVIIATSSGASISGLTLDEGAKFNFSTDAEILDIHDKNDNPLGSIDSSKTAQNITINDGSILTVTAGGSANNITVESDGTINATSDNSKIDGITLNNGAIFNFSTATSVINIKSEDGILTNASIQNNTASNVEIGVDSTLTVVNEGSSIDTIVSGGNLIIEKGTASGGSVSNGGYIKATSSDAIVSDVNIAEDGYFDFSTDANVSATYDNQQITIQDKTANALTIKDGSSLSINAGGTANNTVVDGGLLIANDTSKSKNTTVKGGEFQITGGEIANINVIENGVVNASSGYIFADDNNDYAVTISDNGTVNLSGSAIIDSAKVINNGSLNVAAQSTVNNAQVENSGILNVESQGTVLVSNITQGATANVKSQGVLSLAVINNGGIINTDVGAIIRNIEALNGGVLNLSSGTILSGNLTVDSGANFTGDIDMSSIFSADNEDLINLKITNGVNEAFKNKLINYNTNSDKTLGLADGDYIISNDAQQGSAYVDGWDTIVLSNSTARITSDISMNGNNKEFIIDDTSIIDVSGTLENVLNVSLNGNLINNGTIDFTKQGPSYNDELIINGDYYGGNEAKMLMNIDPITNTADKIIVNGNVSGNTKLYLLSSSAKSPDSNILLVDAPQNTTGDASSFNIWRVSGSPFNWDILFENNKWYGYVTDSDTPTIVPETVAYYGLIDNTFMQTANLGASLRKNIAESELHKVACKTNKNLKYNNRICRNSRPVFTGWAAPVYSSAQVEAPYNYTAEITGLDGGLDIISSATTKFGILASYRQGKYSYDENGENYTLKSEAETIINSYLAGLYIRHDSSKWSILTAIYGGKLDGEISTKDGVSADVTGTTFGATLDVNYIWQNINGLRIEPGIRISYTSVKLDET